MITFQEEECRLGTTPRERAIEDYLEYAVVPLDKWVGPTSHEVSSNACKLVRARKAGHSGTLDFDVSGVLPVLFNNACKIATILLKSGKEYVCVLELGSSVETEELESALAHFRGPIYQRPPLASAVKRVLRIREVKELELLEHDGRWVLFRASVQHGTYIRKLCTDIGAVLGVSGKMAELRRTRAGGFTESHCVTMHDLSDALWLWRERGDESKLRLIALPLEEALHLKKAVVSDGALKPITTGANVAIPGILSLDEGIKEGEVVQVLSGKGECACLARAYHSTKDIVAKGKGFAFDVERVIRQF